MRLVRRAPTITDLFNGLETPPTPEPANRKPPPLSKNHIARSPMSSEREPSYATPRRRLLNDESDKRRRTSSLPSQENQDPEDPRNTKAKGPLSRLVVNEKRKRSVSATEALSPREKGTSAPRKTGLLAAPVAEGRARRGSICGPLEEAPTSNTGRFDGSQSAQPQRLPGVRRLTLAGDGEAPKLPVKSPRQVPLPTINVAPAEGGPVAPLEDYQEGTSLIRLQLSLMNEFL